LHFIGETHLIIKIIMNHGMVYDPNKILMIKNFMFDQYQILEKTKIHAIDLYNKDTKMRILNFAKILNKFLPMDICFVISEYSSYNLEHSEDLSINNTSITNNWYDGEVTNLNSYWQNEPVEGVRTKILSNGKLVFLLNENFYNSDTLYFESEEIGKNKNTISIYMMFAKKIKIL
jgi:hypothetical protein